MRQQNSGSNNDTILHYTDQDLDLIQLKIELTLLRYELLSDQKEDNLNFEIQEQEKIRL